MSRKITAEAISAFINKHEFKKSNTEVVCENKIYYLKLFGNKIAAIKNNYELWITNAGWKSNTTKERLNALPGVQIYQRNGNWFLNDNLWDGSPKYIQTIK